MKTIFQKQIGERLVGGYDVKIERGDVQNRQHRCGTNPLCRVSVHVLPHGLRRTGLHRLTVVDGSVENSRRQTSSQSDEDQHMHSHPPDIGAAIQHRFGSGSPHCHIWYRTIYH